MTEHSPYVTSHEAARYLGVSRQRVDQLMRSGRLPHSWAGPVRIISIANLMRLKRHREREKELRSEVFGRRFPRRRSGESES